MTKRELQDIETSLSVIRTTAEDLHALLLDEYPQTALKMRKISLYVGKLATCIRVHGQLPIEPGTPGIVRAAKIAHRLLRE